MRAAIWCLVSASIAVPAFPQTKGDPFVGRWDFNVGEKGESRACWLGVKDKSGKPEIWFQPTGGNVFEVKEYKLDGKTLSFNISPKTTWELTTSGEMITGQQKRDGATTSLTGVRAPELKRSAPKTWSTPEPLFNGKDLTGWEPVGDAAHSHWKVVDGLLVNEQHGANLKTTRKFEDFKAHYEVNCPDNANSGFYLRGRYEVQIESEPLSQNPVERRIGSIYGRIAPSVELPRKPGEWQTFDVTLVGRTVTVVRNGVTTIDRKEIEGITGGALDANEGEPGPFYIQGDHTGGLKFRNITVSVPKR